ncbi:PREDICTED: trimethylguanosine synthase [Prunus dulcis]|uniref:Trimethylguanosine synthase n=1 Tax=Prunus dulcis TaxID=3755 RepID=A0A5E4EAZ9_PRUDU|nr:uncharacterized protein LOC117624032 isoform X1 [Prunus dulcis]VVA12079.1 PREDICTED: trimethylguanosine synthase [Prunus dulcis]
MVTMVELEEQGPAMTALGSLLKLTEVFLWDDGLKETKDRSFSMGQTKPARDGSGEGSNLLDSECGTLPEDMELTKQMNALGLPVSFLTNKEKRNRKAEGKKKGMRLKHPVTSQGYVVEALESSKVSVGKIVSPVNFDGNTGSSLCCMSMMGQSESSSSDVAADAIKFQSLSVEGDNPASSTEITSDASKEQDRDGILGVVCNDGQDCDSLHGSAVVNDTMKISASTTDLNDGIFSGSCSTDAAISQEPGERLMEHDHLECSLMTLHEAEDAKICEDYVPEKPCVSESVSYSTCSEVLDHDGTDSQDNGDVGDWMVYWDSYYMRNYFYNIRTRTSTWHPPQGMEHISTVDTTYKSNEMTAQVIDMNVTTDLETTDLCGLSKTESFEEAISDDVSQGQPYCELSGGLELTVDNSMSDTTLPTVSLSRCLEHSVELNESNNTGNDGNASYLSSNVQDLASFRNNTKQLVADEVYKNDLEPILAEKTDEPNTIDLYNEPSKINSCEETLEDFEGDDAFQILDMSSLSNTYTEEVSEDFNMHSGTGVPAINEMEMHHDLSVVKRKKKMRRMKIQRKLSNEELLFQGLFKEFSADIGKYWCQRYLLFSRYDDGIKMDEEGWFSVTPEPLARHHAERCGSGIIIDCFTGVGGNSIQFAHISKHVIAIDIDPKKIDYAHHNAAIYGVDDRIDFIKGDFFELAPKLKADTVFLSPPWGGPDYAKVKTYDLRMLKPHDGYFLFNTAKEVASRIVMFLPRNVDLNQLAELALSGSRPWSLEVEKNFLTGKLKGITAYFSDMTGRQ